MNRSISGWEGPWWQKSDHVSCHLQCPQVHFEEFSSNISFYAYIFSQNLWFFVLLFYLTYHYHFLLLLFFESMIFDDYTMFIIFYYMNLFRIHFCSSVLHNNLLCISLWFFSIAFTHRNMYVWTWST